MSPTPGRPGDGGLRRPGPGTGADRRAEDPLWRQGRRLGDGRDRLGGERNKVRCLVLRGVSDLVDESGSPAYTDGAYFERSAQDRDARTGWQSAGLDFTGFGG